MTDLLTIDPATARVSVELDALIAKEWMGWQTGYDDLSMGPAHYWVTPNGYRRLTVNWQPTTNAAHAGEARRRVNPTLVSHGEFRYDGELIGLECICQINVDGERYRGQCWFAEVTGETEAETKEHAEALAICRAILAAIQSKET